MRTKALNSLLTVPICCDQLFTKLDPLYSFVSLLNSFNKERATLYCYVIVLIVDI